LPFVEKSKGVRFGKVVVNFPQVWQWKIQGFKSAGAGGALEAQRSRRSVDVGVKVRNGRERPSVKVTGVRSKHDSELIIEKHRKKELKKNQGYFFHWQNTWGGHE
jgi:hypothetical protein